MITVIEDELLKIIHPVIQRSETPTESYDCRINMDIISSREKITLINNLKTFIKANLGNSSLSIIFSKHISLLFSKILFQCLDDLDQSVRIASDECINLIIRLTVANFSPYIIYNLFIEIKTHTSIRSLNAALHKFSTLSSLIKNSKRMSYINNVLPVLKSVIKCRSSEEVMLSTMVDTLPKIAKNLFPYASDSDIEKSVLLTVIKSLQATVVISNQRYLAQLVAICCFNMKNRSLYLTKTLRYFLSIDFFNRSKHQIKDSDKIENEAEIRAALFVFKSIIASSIDACDLSNQSMDRSTSSPLLIVTPVSDSLIDITQSSIDEWVALLLRLIELIDWSESSGSIKNLCLDCLFHLLQFDRKSSKLSIFLRDKKKQTQLSKQSYRSFLDHIDHESIFEFELEEIDETEEQVDEKKSISDDCLNDDCMPDRSLLTEENENIDLSNDVEPFTNRSREEIDLFEMEKSNYQLSDRILIDNFETERSIIDSSVSRDGVELEMETEIDETKEKDKKENLEEEETEENAEEKVDSSFWLSAMDYSIIDYLIVRLIGEFLPDCGAFTSGTFVARKQNRGTVRVNSKVLAVNCLSQICRLNYRSGLTNLMDGANCLPSVIECVLTYCNDEDAQLSGAAIQLLAQVLRSHFNQFKYSPEPLQSSAIKIDCKKIITTIQSQINNPISGQHLKSVLSSLKLFLYDLISTEYGNMAFDLCESVLRYTDHSYKLVRKEILLLCQVVDFRNLSLLVTGDSGPVIIKKTSLADKFIDAVLELLSDVEQDIREDACESIQFLIVNGAFDRDNLSSDCTCAVHSDVSCSSLTDKSRLIPFLHRNINVSLSDVRRNLQQNCNRHDTQSTVHRVVHLIIERLLSNPVMSTKEMKLPLNKISGCIHALLFLHEKYPLSTHSKVWIGQKISDSGTETRTLIGYCLSLLNTSVVITDICLHSNILDLLSKLIFHGGIKHLLLSNLIVERSSPEIGLSTQLNNSLYFVFVIKQFMTHLCRILNIYWHIFQFITPSVPPHKTVLPNLSSQTHASPAKKKSDPGPTKGSSESQSTADSRPPRTKSSLGYFVSESNYMLIHKLFTVAYNSFLISFDANPHNDRLLNLLAQCINSLGSVFEFLTFSEVSMHIEEFLSYCSIFYNILPSPTVNLIIKLLGSLFGTNLTAQWDPFLAQLYHQIFSSNNPQDKETDLILNILESWTFDCNTDGSSLQEHLRKVSTSAEGNDTSQIYKSRKTLSDIFIWVKASGKRREPGILRQIALTNIAHRPSLGHYIGLFEKHVFQCMRQYLVSSAELQTSIISLLCQLIYLRVNYCQLDSEQKFLNIVLNQLENFTSYNVDSGKDTSLIIEITEFLILISYEKSSGSKKDQPILNITQVIRCIESLLVNGVNVKSVIISCMWKIVCDLFVHRSVWLNNPGNFNLLPNSNTSREIDVQREAIIDFLLRKLIKYPDTLEILTLILEHSARDQEIKWRKLSNNIWNRLATALYEDSIEFSTAAHIDHLYRLLRLISVPSITQSVFSKTLVDLTLKFSGYFSIKEDPFSPSLNENYRLHIVQAVRSVMCFRLIFMHNINYCADIKVSKLTSAFEDEEDIEEAFYTQFLNIFLSILEAYNYTMNIQYLRETINEDYQRMARKLMRMALLILISNISQVKNKTKKGDFHGIFSKLDNQFALLPHSDTDLLLLWNELKLTCDTASNINWMMLDNHQSESVSRELCHNHVLQCCRHITKFDGSILTDSIINLITNYYTVLLHTLHHSSVENVVGIISTHENLSTHLLVAFSDCSKQVVSSTSRLINWLNLIENIHEGTSSLMISVLLDHIICRAQNFSVIVLMKVESIVCSRIDMILKDDINVPSNLSIMEIIKSVSTVIQNGVVPMTLLKRKIDKIDNIIIKQHISDQETHTVSDPLCHQKINSDEVNEKKFWKICVENTLENHDQDIRLGPRLLQGGSANDFEHFFGIKFSSDETLLQLNTRNEHLISKLPPRFIQQCLRLGFLRSGGGSVQEGVKVDLIFRLGEKLVFEELNYIVKKTEICLENQDFSEISSSAMLGLIAAVNDYLSLSCQLSVPMPVSNDASNNLIRLIEFLCICITKCNQMHSRILIEELLMLITTCYGKPSLLTDEGIKNMGNFLTLQNVSVIVDFLYLVVDQFSSNKLRGSMKYSLTVNGEVKNAIRTILILDKILKYYYTGQMEDCNTELQRKLKFAVISVARLPCVIGFTRNPKNVKDLDLGELETSFGDLSHKNIIELDCLTKMNRDDLTAAQTILNSLGWTSKFMFEESWLLFLNLLHDKGPSGALAGKNANKTNFSPEELVELGHCDSLGLLGLTDMILQTTARPNPGNPAVAQLEHKPRDKTPNLIHTKTGRKLCAIHAQLEEEIFHCHRGFKMLSAGWTITSWNLEREDSVLKYRHDQINISVLAKRISIGSRSPQISGSNSSNLDVLSCLQSLPILYQQWLETLQDNKKKFAALWPRACALRSAVMLMDLFSSREQVQWLLDSLLELYKNITIEDDWITTSWLCIGLSKCVSVLETSSNAVLPQNPTPGKSMNPIPTNSIYGLSQSLKLVESCINSDLTILQQSALHSAMSLLQMIVFGKNTWDLPPGSLVELRTMHDMIMRYLDNQLLMVNSNIERRVSLSDSLNSNSSTVNSNSLTQVVSSGAASIASTVSGFTSINSGNTQLSLMSTVSSTSLTHFTTNSLPRILKSHQNTLIRTERHNYLVMATACFYCERYPDALSESDILNNFVSLANNIMNTEKRKDCSPQLILTLCRCLERISLTQRISPIVTDQIIRLCGLYLKTCKSTAHSLPVLGLFLTSCYLSLANSNVANAPMAGFEGAFSNGSAGAVGENQLVMLERINLFWKRLTDTDIIDAVESRILSRLVSSIMTEFMSGEELLNKTIHQLLRCWPRSQCVAKILFDVITKCLNQPEGEKMIRNWTLLVLQSLTSCRPDNLAIWATTIVLVASGSSSRGCLRALFSQCLDWLTRFEKGEENMPELETALCLSATAFIQDMTRDPLTSHEYKSTFMKAMLPGSNIPAFQKFFSIAREKHLL